MSQNFNNANKDQQKRDGKAGQGYRRLKAGRKGKGRAQEKV